MPNLTFVLPHWLYWAGLALFPLAAMFIIHRNIGKENQRISSYLAYFLLLTAGFIGMHRIYLRNRWGFIFIPLFIGLLYSNVQIKEGENTFSNTRNEIVSAKFLIKRETKNIESGDPEAGFEKRLQKYQEQLVSAQKINEEAINNLEHWQFIVRIIAIIILAHIVIDIFLLPPMITRCKELEKDEPKIAGGFVCPIESNSQNIYSKVDSKFTRGIDRINDFVGNFIAYWSAIAVVVYYYEVIARYVFNSPTNWAHEGMFLMFGAQYILAGGYALKENTHVRVDVIYAYLSDKTKALIDVITSAFFFIFSITLLCTGWIFFSDSFSVFEVSFTEWGIQYWPIKFAIPLGAALILLQGISRLLKDIMILKNGVIQNGH